MENFNIEEYNIIDHLEVGSPVFDWMLQEWLEVEDIVKTDCFAIETNNGDYTKNGLYCLSDSLPRLTLEEWHCFSGKPFPKLPEKKVLEVFVLKGYSGHIIQVVGFIEDKKIISQNDSFKVSHSLDSQKIEGYEILERTPYTGTYLK